jgi:hypothetical protein
MKERENFSDEETARRLRATLRAAFEIKPTPLKDIPKRNGGKRAGARKANPRRKSTTS